MAPTYYDMEKLSRMMYDQRLAASLKKIEVKRSGSWDCATPMTLWRVGSVRAELRRNRTVCCYLGE
jgi:hypothetical protein